MKKDIIGDSMNLTISVKWLLQLVVIVAMAVYGFWQLHDRIAQLERSVIVSIGQIEAIEQERHLDEQEFKKAMEAQLSWYEKELNLNPLSWGKKKK